MTNNEPIEQWRNEFIFLNSEIFPPMLDYDRVSGVFYSSKYESQWQGFILAKRSQPVIELPKPFLMVDIDGQGNGHYLMIEQVERSIEKAGYQYKIKE